MATGRYHFNTIYCRLRTCMTLITEPYMPQKTQGQIGAEVDPNGRDPHQPGAKLDAGKLMPWLMIAGFSNALREVSEVTTKGAVKYTPNGWQDVPEGATRYMEAFGRHMIELGTGETRDRDTGCRHKAQMIWNLLASLELEIRAEHGWRPNNG